MGYFLFCESMVEAVLFARDKWLAPTGILFPCEANLYFAPVVSEQFYTNKVTWFDTAKVDGVDVSTLRPYAAEEFTTRCLRCHDLKPEEILAQPVVIKHLDLYTVTLVDVRSSKRGFRFQIGHEQNVTFKWPYHPNAKQVFLCCSHNMWRPVEMSLQAKKWRVALWLPPGPHQYKFVVDGEWMYDILKPTSDDCGFTNNFIDVKCQDYNWIHGFGSWFDVIFCGSDKSKPPITLTTDPRTGYQTCWKQDICLFRNRVPLAMNKTVSGVVSVDRMNNYHRHFQVGVMYQTPWHGTVTQYWVV
eukprot:TRINITY_DN3734_c0_g2_i3.p1 TRINITY_DN3734_c0_g2~~TRINITY_DN3734_c0_g2_i3.p1  ORF type:complete len:301 (-),score=61.56 TRINITY_DN3734_c0_g2_i3:141-1043(-)